MTTGHPEKFDGDTFYDSWIKSEGIPVLTGYHVEDLNTVKVEPWERKGGLGAFIKLEGHEGAGDAYVCEIPSGSSLKPQRHIYEELVLILSGKGTTTVWTENTPRRSFEWRQGSVFAIPCNAMYQHVNTQQDKPARYVAVTCAPLILSWFHNTDFVFNNKFVFSDRYNGQEDYFSGASTLTKGELGRMYMETNFIPNVQDVETYSVPRGPGTRIVWLEMADNTMGAHVSQFPVGVYKKAHRHGAAANIVVLQGSGYSLFWLQGQPRIRLEWKVGSLLVPPAGWFHQHFNTGPDPAKYIALRFNSHIHTVGKAWRFDEDVKKGGDQIEYEDEDPAIRKEYEQELDKKSIKIRM